MVATQPPATEEQVAAREALASAVAETTARVLDAWEDDRLLGQLQAKTIREVKRAVRAEVAGVAPDLIAQLSPWRYRRTIDEIVPRAARMAQGRALRRRMEAEGDLPLEFEFVPSEGITVIQVDLPAAAVVDREAV